MIRAAFKRKANRLHPDQPTGDRLLYSQLKQAYDILKDPSKRKIYDIYGDSYFDLD